MKRTKLVTLFTIIAGLLALPLAGSASAVSQSYNFDDCDWQMIEISSGELYTGTGVSDWAGDDCRQMKAYLKYKRAVNGVIYLVQSPYTMAEYVEATNSQAGTHEKSRGRVQSWETDRWQDTGYIW